MEKTIEELRREAALCWCFSSKVNRFPSPLLTEILNSIESIIGRNYDARVPTFEDVAHKCDELILVDDATTRVMTLTAMFIMGYISPHVDVIASLLNSEDVGHMYDWHTGRVLKQEEALGKSARNYLVWVLRVGDTDLMKELEKKMDHWNTILGYDQTLEYLFDQGVQGAEDNLGRSMHEMQEALDAIQAMWDRECEEEGFHETHPDPFYQDEMLWAPKPPIVDTDRTECFMKEVDGTLHMVTKYLTDEEYKEKKEKDLKESWEYYRADVLACILKHTGTSFAEDKRREVKAALEKISRYAFCEEKDMTKVASIIQLLGGMVIWNNIPDRWLLDALPTT